MSTHSRCDPAADKTTKLRDVDVLIVGSGIAGAAYLRVIADALPAARILMVEAGPRLTAIPGINLKNIEENALREKLQVASQGPFAYRLDETSSEEYSSVQQKQLEFARPGTFLLATENSEQFPAGAASSNVGGMGAHWTCACPAPAGPERIPCFDSPELDRLLLRAQQLLEVHEDLFRHSDANDDVLQRLRAAMPTLRRPAGPMPLACRISPSSGKRIWTGPDTILGSWASRLQEAGAPQTLLAHTLAIRILYEGSTASGAILRDVKTSREFEVQAAIVVIAADSFRSPQLLWNSGIRPPALGCYLNEHPQILCAVTYVPPPGGEDLDIGVYWIPFDETNHPFHGQVMPLSVSPIPLSNHRGTQDASLTLALSWFCRKDVRREDRVRFSDHEADFLGMPAMHIDYGYSEHDLKTFSAAVDTARRTARSLGSILPGEEPRLLPAGRSLHYQGTLRMGYQDDGSSVCDDHCRVWGFDNLFVGGNGVIPTATACNPTLTNAALAIRGAERIVTDLKGSRA